MLAARIANIQSLNSKTRHYDMLSKLTIVESPSMFCRNSL